MRAAVLVGMVEAEDSPGEEHVDTNSFRKQADKLFETIAVAGAVSAQPAALLAALARIGLQVTEKEVQLVTEQIIPSEQTML